jgi:hypothetical protein
MPRAKKATPKKKKSTKKATDRRKKTVVRKPDRRGTPGDVFWNKVISGMKKFLESPFK